MTAPVSLAVASSVEVQAVSVEHDAAGATVLVIDDLSLSVREGEFVVLIGPRGCGGSSLLRAIAGLQPVREGRVEVNGDTPDAARRARAVGYAAAAPALFGWRSVLANVALPLEVAGTARRDARAAALAELGRVGLGDVADRYPSQLTAPQQAAVSVARAFVLEPRLLLLDDPFGGLDAIARDALDATLLARWRGDPRRATRGVLFATHAIDEAVFLASRIVVLSPRPGRIVDMIESDLPDGRAASVRDSERFHAIAHQVREALGPCDDHAAP